MNHPIINRQREALLEQWPEATIEPMTHGRIGWDKVFPCESWKSSYPNVDLKHGTNATGQRWTKEEFRNQKFTVGWIESEGYNIEGWNDLNTIAKA